MSLLSLARPPISSRRPGGGADIHLALTVHTIGKKLHEKGFLVSREESRGRYTKRICTDGARVPVLHLRADSLVAPPSHTADFVDEDYEGPPPEDLLSG